MLPSSRAHDDQVNAFVGRDARNCDDRIAVDYQDIAAVYRMVKPGSLYQARKGLFGVPTLVQAAAFRRPGQFRPVAAVTD